ncbi:MAG: hypothetical protein PHG82_04755 [Candidatus Gracilibacteria bacterium]|nr:hypothetical protein [Candidatus Gracilibacteria bacterium]
MIELKRIIFLVSVLILLVPHISLAADSNATDCSVKPTSDAILDYIKDDRKIVSNIISNLDGGNDASTLGGKTVDTYDKIRSKMIGLSNSIFSWNGYESYFKFYVTLPLSPVEQEIPYEIMRDHKIIQNEGKTLEKILQKLVKNGTDSSSVKNLCDGVAGDGCSGLEGKTARDVITKLMENNSNIADLYRLSVLGEVANFKGDLFLIDKDKLTSYYKEDRVTTYSQNCGFAKKGMDKIKEILDWQKITKQGLIQWDEALLRLRCSGVESAGVCSDKDSKKYKEIEKNLLKNELRRQGLSSNMTKKMLQNLDNFNNTCMGNDLASNAICAGKLALKNSAKSVYNWDMQKGEDGGFIQNFIDTADGIIGQGLGKKENVSIQKLAEYQDKRDHEALIKKELSEVFQAGLGSIGQSTDEEDKLQSKIIDIHLNLVKSIEILNDTAKISCDVSRMQGASLPDGCVK